LKLAARRRFGPRDSGASNAILDAAESVLRNQGYGKVTSRRIAEEAGIRQGLVYYYFKTMDDLLLATFKRRTKQGLEMLEKELQADNSAQAVWHYLTHKVDARLAFEFVALANHHDGIRDEVNRYLEASRKMQAAAIKASADDKDLDLAPATPTAIAFMMYSATLILTRESETGMTAGHDEVRASFEWLLDKFK